MILSLEVHCSVQQQDKMAKYMIEIFGDKLVKGPAQFEDDTLPSPKDLCGKIILKGHRTDYILEEGTENYIFQHH